MQQIKAQNESRLFKVTFINEKIKHELGGAEVSVCSFPSDTRKRVFFN